MEKEEFSLAVDWPLQGIAKGEEVAMPVFIISGEDGGAWAVATAVKEANAAGRESLVLSVQKGRFTTEKEANWAAEEFVQHNNTALKKLIDKSVSSTF